jgi:hypothetical protein
MIVTTPRRGRVAAALIAAIAALAISVAPSYSAQGGRTASNAPTAVCGGGGSCS